MQKTNLEKGNGSFPVLKLQKNGGSHSDLYSFGDFHRLHRKLHDRCDWRTCLKFDIKKGFVVLFLAK
jgi:hypothetical protein